MIIDIDIKFEDHVLGSKPKELDVYEQIIDNYDSENNCIKINWATRTVTMHPKLFRKVG